MERHRKILTENRRRGGLGGASVERLLDIESIRELLTAYCVYFDSRDVECLVDLFVTDAHLRTLQGDFEGVDEIRRSFEDILEIVEGTLHTVTNVTITFETQDGALVSSYHDCMGRPGQGAMGTYTDIVERKDGLWRFRERIVAAPFIYKAVPLAPERRFEP